MMPVIPPILQLLGEFDSFEEMEELIVEYEDLLHFYACETDDWDCRQNALNDLHEAVHKGYLPKGAIPTPLDLFSPSSWNVIKDGNPAARTLYERHYSARESRAKGTKLFVGPGEKLVLMTPQSNALFVWRRSEWRKDGQIGIECMIFRNEGVVLSSQLILAAERIALCLWPSVFRFFTYVAPNKVRSSNPGFCFKMAGWKPVTTSKKGLICLEKLP